MIRFSPRIDTTTIAPLVEQKLQEAFDRGIQEDALTQEIYVFGVAPQRDADMYLSEEFDERLKAFIEGETGWTVATGPLGEPPHDNWVAFKARIRQEFPNECATICMLLMLHLNQQFLTT